MTAPEKHVKIGDTEYVAKFSFGDILRAEKELGRPISNIGVPSLADLSIIVRNGLYCMDGTPISKQEFEEKCNMISVEEFSKLADSISPC